MAWCSRWLVASTLVLLTALGLGGVQIGWLDRLSEKMRMRMLGWVSGGHQQQNREESLLCLPGPGCDVLPEAFGYDSHAALFTLGEAARERVMSAFQQRAVGKLETGALPLGAHIGAHILFDHEVKMYEKLTHAAKDKGKWVFVEPQPPVFEELQRNVMRIPAFATGSAEVRVINGAVCPSDSQEVVLHVVGPRLFEEFPAFTPYKIRMAQLSSLSRDTLIGNLRLYFGERLTAQNISLSEEALLPYVEVLVVRCFSPDGLLSELGARPSDLDYFVIDAEGYDVELLSLFLSSSDFEPAVVVFEWIDSNMTEQRRIGVAQMVRRLAARGYEVHMMQENMVAFRPAAPSL